MNLDTYTYQTNATFFDFEFKSVGPKGSIRKVARFTSIGPSRYNFGFGDLNIITGEISDTVVSNNSDGDKILATVAQIIFDFTAKYPEAAIFIKGSSAPRTRRYQMGLNRYWNEIKDIFHVYGIVEEDGKWEDFQQGINYLAFLGIRKTSI